MFNGADFSGALVTGVVSLVAFILIVGILIGVLIGWYFL